MSPLKITEICICAGNDGFPFRVCQYTVSSEKKEDKIDMEFRNQSIYIEALYKC